MQHYLIRHADAVDLTPDEARPLSGKGRSQVAALGVWLRGNGALAPDEIWHSTLLRAQETAKLLAAAVTFSGPVREMAGLEPEADPAVMARALAGSKRSIAVVGHEPHLGVLASILLVAQPARPVVQMRKCAALAIEGGGAYWQVSWHLVPELFV
jgi:phosphohistidine phosphatase